MHCIQFPRYNDCRGDDRYFCSMWRSVGFLMSFAVVLEGMTLAAFTILLVGGKQKREQGWGVLTILVVLAAFAQAIGMALMVRGTFDTAKTWADNLHRHICTKTTRDSSQAGFWTRAGPCAQSRGASRSYARSQSHLPPSSSQAKVDTS